MAAHGAHKNGDDRLTERQRLILREIVDAHIKNGDPVGSKALTKIGGREYSSATIRNEMAALEEHGYLESPHTSSGRIPTELGYRFYVDWLRQRYEMTSRELETLNSVAAAKLSELDSILDEAAKLASAMTNYTALTVRSKRRGGSVRRFETVFLNKNDFLLVIMLTEDNIRTVRVRSEQSITPECISRLSELLNRYVAGVPADEITLPIIMEMERGMGIYSPLISPIIKNIYEAMNDGTGGEVHVDGVNNLLQYPEFSDIGAVKDLLSMFDRREDIVKLVSDSPTDDVNVYIGSENAVDVGGNSSIVFRTIKRNGEVVGAIGIIGPRRMDYSRVMTLIEGLAGSISDAVSRGGAPLLPEATDGGKENDTGQGGKQQHK